ncbi:MULTISPECIES: hypothetical protein [unclassified Pseudomonas]|uniref:hypothetical protein n=1 Tax=unclassified Pseudomonas TaxID=196821 RepID=UPI00191341D4|nr:MULTISPECIES: hypothetical protein [unclassified Pseudomonas]MBK5344379.1 hypothetical protein [Pseudomonas sp. TH49]
MTLHNTGLTAEQACEIVLGLSDNVMRDGKPVRFVIQSCELSANGDYWVIRSNSEDYVVHGMTEYCYVGVNAHLINVRTGEHDTVVGWSVDEHLQDKYDLEAASGKPYVLIPIIDRSDKTALVNLRRKLQCTYPQTLALLTGEQRLWLTGKRRILEDAQRMLLEQGINTQIELVADAGEAIAIDVETWYTEAVLKAVRKRLC